MQPDEQLRTLCALLFSEPERIVQVARRCHRREPWVIQPHVHDDIMQLDLLTGLKGSIDFNDKTVEVGHTMMIVVYPGDSHGYHLAPRTQHPAIYSVKLRLPADLPIVAERGLTRIHVETRRKHPLPDAMERLRLSCAKHPRTFSVLSLVALSEALLLWPHDQQHGAPLLGGGSSLPRDERVERAVAFIEQNLAREVSAEEAARAACLSSRQLRRRFLLEIGMPLHAYIYSRRVMLARELLAEEGASVTRVAEAMDFGSIHAFSRWFDRHAGHPPSEELG